MKKVCVVGAGIMGASIAQVFASKDWKVVLFDTNLELAGKGKQKVEAGLMRLLQKEKISEEDMKKLLEKIVPSNDLKDAKDCSLAIEAIYEDLEAKQKLFKQLEQILPEDSILATNTSSISITEIANVLNDPARLVGMHFFNPAAVMKLVEVIGGAHSKEEYIERVIEIAREIGKVPVKAKESSGFIVNRILIPMINEAIGVLADGVACAEDIDTAMKLGASHPMGPLALSDLVGNDVVLAIMEVIYNEMSDTKYRPHPLFKKMVRAGWLGKKTGKGFFEY